MGDVMSPEQRSRAMGRIRGKDTAIEATLRKAIWHRGYRYYKNYKGLPGSPDIAILRYRVAVFCDGEFFHGYRWEEKKQRLGRNREYWIKKIERNIARDIENDLRLIALGWAPIHFWGREILEKTGECLEAIEDLILELRMQGAVFEK